MRALKNPNVHCLASKYRYLHQYSTPTPPHLCLPIHNVRHLRAIVPTIRQAKHQVFQPLCIIEMKAKSLNFEDQTQIIKFFMDWRDSPASIAQEIRDDKWTDL